MLLFYIFGHVSMVLNRWESLSDLIVNRFIYWISDATFYHWETQFAIYWMNAEWDMGSVD